ncbi:Uncharacterised protein [Citrobacter freundii]|nr:Uncharacterised protein [Citrobacter freundii]
MNHYREPERDLIIFWRGMGYYFFNNILFYISLVGHLV